MDDLSKRVAYIESELAHYQAKSITDDQLIDMLKQQNARQASELVRLAKERDDKIREIQERCDLAITRETEISGLLHVAARGIMKGLARLHNDKIEAGLNPVTDVSEIRDGAAGVRQMTTKLPPQVSYASDRG